MTLLLPSGETSSLHCTLPSMCSVWQWCRLQRNQSSLILAYMDRHIPLAHTPMFLCQQLEAAMCLRTSHPKTHTIHMHFSLSDLLQHSENNTNGYFCSFVKSFFFFSSTAPLLSCVCLFLSWELAIRKAGLGVLPLENGL